jgi:1-acyl-sn-glycerol-3-phosphate acyltransferase
MLEQNSRSIPRSLSQILARFILGVFGWKVVGQRPATPKYVLVGAHHTSGWDFPLALLLAGAMGVRIRWIGKASLFKGPFGRFAYWLGGIPVDRTQRTNFVQQMVDRINAADELVLTISPEGTRVKTDYWHTGFYYIATGAHVPIVPAYLDYATRTAGFGSPIWPHGDIAADLVKLRHFYANVQGRHPENHGKIELRPPQDE